MNHQSLQEADVSITEDSATDRQHSEKNDTIDANDVHHLDDKHDSGLSSSEEEQMSEVKGYSCPTGTVLIQASLMEEQKSGEGNENGNNSAKASIGASSMSFGATEPDGHCQNVVLQKLLRGPRYFDNPECSYEFSKDDAQKIPKKRKPCYLCADNSHDRKHCKQVTTCLICCNKGHLIMDCPQKNVEADSSSKLCLKCGNMGHDMFSCGDEYDPEDLKHINCYICKEPGHLCCVKYKTEGPREPSCYNCGESGHLGSECKQLNNAGIELQSMPMCSKCRKRGLPRAGCPKCLKVKARKENASEIKEKDVTAAESSKGSNSRKSRRKKKKKPMPPVNASQSQPNRSNTWHRPQVVGPYFGRPRLNVWLSPAARSSYPTGGFPQNSNPTQVPQTSVVYPLTQLSHLIWNREQGNQFPQLPVTVSQIPQNTFHHPMPQLPHLTWNRHRGAVPTQQSLYHHSEIQQPYPATATPPSSFHPTSQLPLLFWNRGMATQIPQQILNHPTWNQNNRS